MGRSQRRRSISLYPNPPFPSPKPKNPMDDIFCFSPIRIAKTPPRATSNPSTSKGGLGKKNVLNTFKSDEKGPNDSLPAHSTPHAETSKRGKNTLDASKSNKKRKAKAVLSSEVIDLTEECSPKRQRLASTDSADFQWLKDELSGMRGEIKEMKDDVHSLKEKVMGVTAEVREFTKATYESLTKS